MLTQNKEPKIKEKRSAVEKPVSLWGASFTEAVAALLKTKPMPKEKNHLKSKKGSRNENA